MTPMIDVVFLLIIFFLVSSHLARRETRLPVELASASGGQLPTASDEFATLTIDDSGTCHLAGQTITVAELPRALAALSRRGDGPVRVRVRIDQSLKFESVRPILRTLAESGVDEISLATTPMGSTGP